MKSLAFIVACCFAVTGLADVVHLKDGTTLEGSIEGLLLRRICVVTDASGKTTTVPAESVTSFEIKKTVAPLSAQENLDSLRRSVVNLDDLKQIVSRYKSFIAQYASTPSAGEAEKDLAQWQDRLDKGMVKAGRTGRRRSSWRRCRRERGTRRQRPSRCWGREESRKPRR